MSIRQGVTRPVLGALIAFFGFMNGCLLLVDTSGYTPAKGADGSAPVDARDDATSITEDGATDDGATEDGQVEAVDTDADSTDADTPGSDASNEDGSTDATPDGGGSTDSGTKVDGSKDATTIDAPIDTGAFTPPAGSVVWPTNGHAYLLVVPPSEVTWSAADSAAKALGGHLVTLNSSAENSFVYGLFSSRNDVWNDRGGPWTGGRQTPGASEPDHGWTWVTGESWNYELWNSGQPNNLDGNEDRVVYGIQKPSWNDTASSNTQPAYVVEFE
jgi:hypothetical protein